MTVFSERLRELRTQNKVMVKEIAELLKITARNYQRYEKGEIDPPTSKTIFLADYFDVSTDYLLGRTDNPNSHKA